MLGKRSKSLVVLLTLLVVPAANATTTVSKCNSNFVVFALSPSSDVHISVLADVTHTIESGNSHLAEAATEFLKPPAAFTDPPVGVKSLPAVPGALLMVLNGFLCVSLVKDHKVWLAALAGLLWIGRAGIQAVPQLVLHLSHRHHTEQQLDAELTYPYYLKNSNRLRSDIEGTQYIGLLRHLAGIPQTSSAFTDRQPATLVTFSQRQQDLYGKVLTYHHKITFTLPSAIIPGRYSFNLLFNCLDSKVEQPLYISTQFVFADIPRGPPRLGQRVAFL